MLNSRAGAVLPNYYTRSQIISRFGWTEKMLRFLPKPDLTIDYPIPRQYGRKDLYALETVMKVMQSESFLAAYTAQTEARLQKDACKRLSLLKNLLPRLCRGYADRTSGDDDAWEHELTKVIRQIGPSHS